MIHFILRIITTISLLNNAHFHPLQCTGMAERAYIVTRATPLNVQGDAKRWRSANQSKEPTPLSLAIQTGGKYGHAALVLAYDSVSVLVLDRNYKFRHQIRVHILPRNQIDLYLN